MVILLEKSQFKYCLYKSLHSVMHYTLINPIIIKSSFTLLQLLINMSYFPLKKLSISDEEKILNRIKIKIFKLFSIKIKYNARHFLQNFYKHKYICLFKKSV